MKPCGMCVKNGMRPKPSEATAAPFMNRVGCANPISSTSVEPTKCSRRHTRLECSVR